MFLISGGRSSSASCLFESVLSFIAMDFVAPMLDREVLLARCMRLALNKRALFTFAYRRETVLSCVLSFVAVADRVDTILI